LAQNALLIDDHDSLRRGLNGEPIPAWGLAGERHNNVHKEQKPIRDKGRSQA
jgi:hypothetical protein